MAKKREPVAAQPVELQVDASKNATPAAPEPEITPETRFTFRPVPVMPTTTEGIINNLMVRGITDPSGEVEPLSPTVGLLQQLAHGLTYGDDLNKIKPELLRIAQHQPEKSDLFNAVINQINKERIADNMIIICGAEKRLKHDAQRGDLSTGEAIAVWRNSREVIKEIKAEEAETSKAVDTITIVEKVDYTKQQVERTVQKRWENTTPFGREIIRKKLFELKQQMVAANDPQTSIPV